MKALTFSEKAKAYLLTEQERLQVEKFFKAKDVNLYNKIIGLNELFYDGVIQEPLDAIMNRIKAIQGDLQKVDDYMNDGERVKVYAGKDEDGNPLYTEYDKPIGILSDKSNGLPERTGALVKELKSSSEDVLDLIHVKRVRMGIDAIEEKEIGKEFEGMSWADRQAAKAKKNL
jgi:hypothetical protein